MDTPSDRAPDSLGEDDRGLAAEAVSQVEEHLRRTIRSQLRLSVSDPGEREIDVALPDSVVETLVEVLRQAAAGRMVTVLNDDQELTTQQAADLLNVSRPHLVKLLESGEITYRLVGSRRRVRAGSLVAYRRGDRA